MNSMPYESPTKEFKRKGFYYTNNAEVIAIVIMELKDEDVYIKGCDAGDWKYGIILE